MAEIELPNTGDTKALDTKSDENIAIEHGSIAVLAPVVSESNPSSQKQLNSEVLRLEDPKQVGSRSESSPENDTDKVSQQVAPPDIKLAEREAREAMQNAVEKIRKLQMTTSVNLETEIEELDKAIGSIPPPFNKPPQRLLDPVPPRGPPSIAAFELERPCEVQRLPMDQWLYQDHSVSGPYGPRPPLPLPPPPPPPLSTSLLYRPVEIKHRLPPVIQAFYRNVPAVLIDPVTISTDEDFKKAHSDTRGAEKPQRVKINSSLLLRDLEDISRLTLPNHPHLMIAPYKLLIHNWSGILSTLDKLNRELEAENDRLAQEKPSASQRGDSPQVDKISDNDKSINTQITVTSAVLNNDEPEPEAKAMGGDSGKEGIATVTESVYQEKGISEQHTSASEDGANQKLEAEDDDDMPPKSELALRVAHLTCLRDFIKTELGHFIGLRLKVKEGSLESITFEELYHLYSPGDLLINRKAEADCLLQVYGVTGGRMRLLKYSYVFKEPNHPEEVDNSPDAGIGTWTDLVVDCFSMRWDGGEVGPIRTVYRVQHFMGKKKITDLDLYPIRFRANPDELCKSFMTRGKRVLECSGHKKYEGFLATPPRRLQAQGHRMPPPEASDPFSYASNVSREIDSDVYVDFKAFYRNLPPPSRNFSKLTRVLPSRREVAESFHGRLDLEYHIGDHDVDELQSDAFLSANFHFTHPKIPEDLLDWPEFLLLLPHAVPAYDFQSRDWVWLNVDNVEEIDKSEEARTRGWENLVIPKGYSELLLSLVDNHSSAADHKRKKNRDGHSVPSAQIDLVKGKGRGLIIMLHGPPGTGKTSTAETIAAYTGKPLYAITCGDIGVTVREVEENLRNHTQRAAEWGCVLLLDEADVFLARRSWEDMHRNAMVSVFLRHLEYYSGILFLTTNIIGIIDEAFKSRIHVALRYDTINLDSTERIWNNLLDRIEKDNLNADVKIKFDREILLDFARAHYAKNEEDETSWNARQIRNAFTTAIAMGQFDRLERVRKAKLTPEEVKKSGKSLKTIKLTYRNFDKIAETAADFEKYINSVRGHDVSNALMNQQRDDYFGRQVVTPQKKYRSTRGHTRNSGLQEGTILLSSSRSAKGKSAAKKRVEVDSDDDDEVEEEEEEKAKATRMMDEEFSDDDD